VGGVTADTVMNTKSDIAPSLFAMAIRFYDFGRNSSHRNLNSGSPGVKKWGKSAQGMSALLRIIN
jgi:hypothetical protein